VTPLEAAQHLSDLKANKWTSDEWDLFWSTFGLSDDLNAELEAHWNEGYDTGREDGKPEADDDYDTGYADGIEERMELIDMLTLALPYVEEEAKLPNYKPGSVEPLLARIRKAIK
jgi:hypothetical protein